VGGSFAQVNLPSALASAAYNAANQLTSWGTSNLTYDLDGNLLTDGLNNYTWNARNQLASISGGVAATFQYDGLGRRSKNAVGTSFVYDGLNPVQELSGNNVSATLVTGLGIDEVFQPDGHERVELSDGWARQHGRPDGLDRHGAGAVHI